MKLNKSQWEPKKYDPYLIEQETTNVPPYTDGRVDVIRVTSTGIKIVSETLTKSEWMSLSKSQALRRLVLDV